MLEEHSVILLKPDAIERQLVGTILRYFEIAELEVVSMYMFEPLEAQIRGHYSHLADKGLHEVLDEIVEYMAHCPIIGLILRGEDCVNLCRKICGATEPISAAPESIRGSLGGDSWDKARERPRGQRALRNLVHSSDSEESFKAEARIWFPKPLSKQELRLSSKYSKNST